MNLRTINIAPRAAFCFALITLLVIGLGVFSLFKLNDLYQAEKEIEANWMTSIQATGEMQKDLLNIRLETLRLLAVGEGAAQQSVDETAAQKYRSALDVAVKKYQDELVSSEEERNFFSKVSSATQAYLAGQQRIIDLLHQNQVQQALSLANGQVRTDGETLQQRLDELVNFNMQGAEQAGIFATATYENARTGVIVTIAVAVVLTVLLAMLLTRSIVGPINEALLSAESIAAGDLTRVVTVSGRTKQGACWRLRR